MGKRILSGMQPTNNLHLGNYLGALKNWIKLQDEGAQCLYMIADLHAITANYAPEKLSRSTREIAAAFIASGIKPEKSDIFVQSAVPGHSELMWLLSSKTQMGKLERMTQFKDKAGKNAERAGLGLFSYPVLMAADILIYQATHVPVGEDQKQHLELSRDIASTFNAAYGQCFTVPEPFITGPAPRVMSLRNGSKKMSKSDDSDYSRINLTDDADTIAKKIKKATTDPQELPGTLDGFEGRAEALNLITIYAALADKPREAVITEFAGKQFSVFKPALADIAVAKLAPITNRMSELLAHPGEIDKILRQGNQKANSIAQMTVADIRHKMGFWR